MTLLQLSDRSIERRGVFDADDLHGFVDLAHESGEGAIGAEFDEERVTGGDEVLHAFDPAHAAGDLAGKRLADLLGVETGLRKLQMTVQRAWRSGGGEHGGQLVLRDCIRRLW
jgi:hypothetical protein